MTQLFALATLIGNVMLLGALAAFIFRRAAFERFVRGIAPLSLAFAFAVALASLVGSLIYSEVVGFAACILCWIQRVFMYPLPFLLGLAIYRRETVVIPYAALIAWVGAAVALYNWVKDMLSLYAPGLGALPCPATPGLPSCDRIYVLEFGYVTIAMFSLNAFAFILFFLYAAASRIRKS